MALQGVIFDFNGTLVEDSPLHEAAWREFSSQIRGYPLTEQELELEVHGRVNSHILEYLLKRELQPDEADILSNQKEEIYRALCLNLGDKFHLSPGAEKLLNALITSETPITIATASGMGNLNFFVERLNLSKWFDVTKVVFDDGTFPGKPEPDIFIKAAGKLSLPPEKCVVIEDSLSGLEAANRANVGKIVAIGPKERHLEIRNTVHVDLTIESFGELSEDILLR
jgi:beta-phosphoglucomutase